MTDMEMQMIRALAAIDDELGMPQDGCNSTDKTLTAIRLLNAIYEDDQKHIAELKAKLAEYEKRYPKSALETHPMIPNSKCKCEHWQRCPECTPSLKGTP